VDSDVMTRNLKVIVWNKIGMVVHPKRRRYGCVGHLPNQIVDCWVRWEGWKRFDFFDRYRYTESAYQVIRVPILLV